MSFNTSAILRQAEELLREQGNRFPRRSHPWGRWLIMAGLALVGFVPGVGLGELAGREPDHALQASVVACLEQNQPERCLAELPFAGERDWCALALEDRDRCVERRAVLSGDASACAASGPRAKQCALAVAQDINDSRQCLKVHGKHAAECVSAWLAANDSVHASACSALPRAEQQFHCLVRALDAVPTKEACQHLASRARPHCEAQAASIAELSESSVAALRCVAEMSVDATDACLLGLNEGKGNHCELMRLHANRAACFAARAIHDEDAEWCEQATGPSGREQCLTVVARGLANTEHCLGIRSKTGRRVCRSQKVAWKAVARGEGVQ